MNAFLNWLAVAVLVVGGVVGAIAVVAGICAVLSDPMGRALALTIAVTSAVIAIAVWAVNRVNLL